MSGHLGAGGLREIFVHMIKPLQLPWRQSSKSALLKNKAHLSIAMNISATVPQDFYLSDACATAHL